MNTNEQLISQWRAAAADSYRKAEPYALKDQKTAQYHIGRALVFEQCATDLEQATTKHRDAKHGMQRVSGKARSPASGDEVRGSAGARDATVLAADDATAEGSE